MRRTLRTSGNVLLAISLLGLAALGAAQLLPEGTSSPIVGTSLAIPGVPAGVARKGGAPHPGFGDTAPRNVGVSAATTDVLQPDPGRADEPFRPITHVVIDSVELSVDVVPAEVVEVDGGYTWHVPAFKVGHAAGTAGAGARGNAILLGHVTSLRSGNVFQNLERVQQDDVVRIFADAEEFDYRVVSTTHVARSDSDSIQPDQSRSVSLITCTGTWLPTIWDYTERLVVRAELSR